VDKIKVGMYMRVGRATNVALYSHVIQADEKAIESQEKALRLFAEVNGYKAGEINVHHHYRDNGESELTLSRPGMNKLRADIQNGRVDVAIVDEITRVTHDMKLFKEWQNLLRENDVTLISISDEIIK